MAKAEVATKADRAARAAMPNVPATPGVGNGGGLKTTPTPDGKKGGDGGVGKAAGLDATTAVSKSTTITIRLKSLVESGIHLHAATVEDGPADLESKITDTLLRVLNSSKAT